jgi:uncharacterized protein YraI
VSGDLNLRSGPGTGYRVIDTMPAGSYVDVLGCTGSWCQVQFAGVTGYASASYLGGGGYAAAPVYAEPPIYSGPYYAGPAFGLGVGFWPRWGWGGGWHHRWHHHRHHHH